MKAGTVEVILETIKKIGTLIVDRRLIFYVAMVLLVLLGVPEAAEEAESLDAQVRDLIVLAGQIIAIVLGMIATISSWTKRAPSGLQYSKLVDNYTELRKVRDLLEELGIKLD